jgi:hypothetical protein
VTKQEVRITTKIIRELSLFMMIHDYTDFQIALNVTENETLFTITLDHASDAFLNKMTEKISRERELEVETYGWELVGDIDSKSELEILGLLIDTIKIEKNNKTVISLIRKNRYKK